MSRVPIIIVAHALPPPLPPILKKPLSHSRSCLLCFCPLEPRIVKSDTDTQSLHSVLPSQPTMSSQPTESSLESLTPPSEPSTAIETPQKRRLYCLTICVRRRPTLSEEEYEAYLRKHAQISKDLLAKYGVIRWSYVGNLVRGLLHLCGAKPDAAFSEH